MAALSPVETLTELPAWLSGTLWRDLLESLGGDACARLVGGCVRNAVLGRDATDIDIATTWTPDAVTEKLAAEGWTVYPTGVAHGTVTAVKDGFAFEVTTLRADVETDGRHAVVAFTDDWRVDAQRRDFTMNALYMDASGHVYDPTGQGVADARAGLVRFIGEPAQRIAEDKLRILRYFRFLAWYGQGGVDGPSLHACEQAAYTLPRVSVERITAEVLKLLAAPDPAPALRLMLQYRIYPQLFGFKPNLAKFAALLQSQYPPVNVMDTLARLYMLNPQAADILRLSNNQKKTLQVFDSFDRDSNLSHLLYQYPRELVYAMLPLAGRAVERAKALTQEIPVFPVDAKQIMAKYNLEPGPEVGAKLREAEEAWLKTV